MKENIWSTTISILVHAGVILLLVTMSLSVQEITAKVIEIDFAIARVASSGAPQKVAKEMTAGNARIPEAMKAPTRSVESKPETLQPHEQVEPPPVPVIAVAPEPVQEQASPSPEPVVTAMFDSRDKTSVPGTPQVDAGLSGSGGASHDQGESARGTKVVEDGGTVADKGGVVVLEEGEEYDYISDVVGNNIRAKYPPMAQKRGIGGELLISFIVLENGTTSRIKVEKSSGHWMLDDHAMQCIARTVIPRKMPFRYALSIPVTYRIMAANR
jgi:protein TonB